jgi:hypothetical protein
MNEMQSFKEERNIIANAKKIEKMPLKLYLSVLK